MSKVVHPSFTNSFEDTTGFTEYGKYLSGKKLNESRLFITEVGVYQIGDDKATELKGHGGREHIMYWRDGTTSRSSDLWLLCNRIDEVINGIKLENVYTPREDILWDSGLRKHEVLGKRPTCFMVPKELLSKITCHGSKGELTRDRLRKDLSRYLQQEQDPFYRQCWRSLQRQTKTGYEIGYYTSHLAEEDFSILRSVYTGNTNLLDFTELVMASRWQTNIDIFPEILSEVKQVFASREITLNFKSTWLSNMLRWRHLLMEGRGYSD